MLFGLIGLGHGLAWSRTLIGVSGSSGSLSRLQLSIPISTMRSVHIRSLESVLIEKGLNCVYIGLCLYEAGRHCRRIKYDISSSSLVKPWTASTFYRHTRGRSECRIEVSISEIDVLLILRAVLHMTGHDNQCEPFQRASHPPLSFNVHHALPQASSRALDPSSNLLSCLPLQQSDSTHCTISPRIHLSLRLLSSSSVRPF